MNLLCNQHKSEVLCVPSQRDEEMRQEQFNISLVLKRWSGGIRTRRAIWDAAAEPMIYSSNLPLHHARRAEPDLHHHHHQRHGGIRGAKKESLTWSQNAPGSSAHVPCRSFMSKTSKPADGNRQTDWINPIIACRPQTSSQQHLKSEQTGPQNLFKAAACSVFCFYKLKPHFP